MTEATPPPLPETPPKPGRRVPVVGLVLGGWVVIWLLMMWHGDWPWVGQGWLDFGSPRRATLKLFGAFIPASFRWQSLFLAPLLHASLLGLVFLVFFWRSVGGLLVQVLGPSWTWVVFVGGGLASAYGHMQAHPYGALPFAVGPFDPILCAIGVQFGWGLLHKAMRSLAGRAVKTLLFLAVWMLLMALLSGLPLDKLGEPRVREAMGAEAMLAALSAGIAFAIVLTILQRIAPAPSVWLGRGLAAAALVCVVAAGTTQATPILQSAERSEAAAFLEQLRTVERSVKTLTKRSDAAQVERNELAVAHGRLVNHAFLDDFAGRDALLAYAEVLGMYMRPVEAPFITEPQLRKRFRAWYDDHEKALRERYALPERAFDPWEGL